jgi:hypothetical protein
MGSRDIAAVVALLLILPGGGIAQPQPRGQAATEIWEAAFLEGNQVGHLRTVVREVAAGEQKIIEASQELDLSLVRFGQTLRLNFAVGNHETLDGKVLAIIVRQGLSKDQQIVRKGKVEGKQLTLQTQIGNSPPVEKKVPLGDQVVGLVAEQRLFRGRKLTPDSQFDYQKFVPEFDTVLTMHVAVKDYEEVALLKGQKQRLLRVETKTDKIMNVELPVEIGWLDAKGEFLKRQTEIPGLGQLVIYRTTKEQALARGGRAPVDIGLAQLVKVNRLIQRPNETREAVYQVRLKGVEEPQKAFATDDRQAVRNVKQDQFEIVVRGLQRPAAGTRRDVKPPEDYLKSNHFIRSADAQVRSLAAKAVGDERDPWRQALRIERWVGTNLKDKNFTEAFATADQVARSLEGDCTEHAVLAAAMCRAVGIPARTAIGLVYVPHDRAMGYHMWIEVWIDGKWYALDPTLGQGRVGAAHLKIIDHHWNDTHSFTPLLPVVRVLGKLELDVISVQYEGQERRP